MEGCTSAIGPAGERTRISDLERQLAEQSELAEQFRCEAADLRTMFDAMEHRIAVLQKRLQAAPADRYEAQAVDEVSAAQAASVEAELRAALAETEHSLAATRLARDQWIERLEVSGREKAELEQRLAAADEQLAELGEQLAATRIAVERAALAEKELEFLRSRLADSEQRREAAEADARRHGDELGRLALEMAAAEDRIAAVTLSCDSVESQVDGAAIAQAEIKRCAASLQAGLEAAQQRIGGLLESVSGDGAWLDGVETRLRTWAESTAESAVARALDTQAQDTAALDAERSAAQSRIARLETELAEVVAALEAQRSKLQERVALREQLAEVEAQRSALAEEVERERTQRIALEEKASAISEDTVSQSELRERLVNLQASFDEAVNRHAEEARALREELNLQKSLVRDREHEIDRLAAECAILQESVEDAIADIENAQDESLVDGDGFSDDDTDPGGDFAAEEDASDLAAGKGSFANGEPAAPLTVPLSLVPDAKSEDAADEAVDSVTVLEQFGVGETVVVAVDEDPAFLAAIEHATGMVTGARFAAGFAADVAPGSTVHLVVNLASESFSLDRLDEIQRLGIDEPEALVYCARNGRGVFYRSMMFFPPPCDIDECSTRLLAATGDSLQRLLVVGEDVDFMSGLRDSFGRIRASTAIAFDGRQAIDLLPMVKPQAILIDLNLPRGDGLRVASQVAANPDLRYVRIGAFWSRPVDPQVFRQQSIYAVRDFHMTPEQLARELSPALGILPTASASVGAVPAAIRRGSSRPPNLLGN